MADTIDGTILQMRALDPNGTKPQEDGQIWRSRETQEPTRESIFVWDPTAYDGRFLRIFPDRLRDMNY